MYRSKIRTALMLLLSSSIMPMQAWDVGLYINGKDVISPLISQMSKASAALIDSAQQGLEMAGKTMEGLRVPCLWQCKDGKIDTTYIHPGYLAIAGASGFVSVAAFKGAWNAYQNSKYYYSCDCYDSYVDEYKNNERKRSCILATVGTIYAGLAAVVLYHADKVLV